MSELSGSVTGLQPNHTGLLSTVYSKEYESGSPEGAFLIDSMSTLRKSKLRTPIDELTGMPLPVLPPTNILDGGDAENNWHHHYHPANDKRLTSTNGLALRHVRLQLLPVTSHNSYHSIFEGPQLPRTNQERFGQIILASAGYIPAKAINVLSNDPEEPVGMSKKMRRRLQTSGEIEVRGHSNISNFIKNHLIGQDFSEVDELVIEEFIYTSDIERKRVLGQKLLAIASDLAIEPIKPVYKQALNDGLLAEPRPKLINLVTSKLNGRKTSKKTIQALHKRLAKKLSDDSLQTGVDAVQFTG
jgi:hypothetical protein